MTQERNPLDLNNLPDDYTRYGKQVLEESSSTSVHKKKKKRSSVDGKDESANLYECRFCSLKFCKSQALGGHMNRHRQERETEALHRARQLVFSNDSLIAQGPHHHLGSTIYPTILLSGGDSSSSTLLPPHSQPYMYTSNSRPVSYPSHYGKGHYFVGHGYVLSGCVNSLYSPHDVASGDDDANYTCIGAPVGSGFVAHSINESSRGSTMAISGAAAATTRGDSNMWALPLHR